MTQAVAVRRDGDAFQARLFWVKAARLLDGDSPIRRVGFEIGPKGFDDIWVEFDPASCPPDHEGHPLQREHCQCKWHVNPGTFGYADLTDPEFINANTRSLLQRAREAQLKFAPEGTGSRFKFITNWRIERSNPLRPIVRQRSNNLDLGLLFGTSTDKSNMGLVRKSWREHLAIDDSQLRTFARTVAIAEATDSLDDLRDNLDILFRAVGLRRIPVNESAFAYDDIVFQWLSQGRLEFDRESFRDVCAREGLLVEPGGRPTVYGVKSFEHPIDRLEDRCVKVLDLVPWFDERYIRSAEDWASELYPALQKFLLEAAKEHERLRLVLDAHVTLAYVAGSVLNIKSGRTIELEQRTTARRVWSADDSERNPAWPTLVCEVEQIRGEPGNLAIAVGLTHDVAQAVRDYVTNNLPDVSRILACRPSTGPSSRSVAGGRHAFELAESLTAHIRSLVAERGGLVHLFIAAPNAFAFFMGQRQVAIGGIRLYEFDFEGARGGSYKPSLVLPISTERKI